MGDKVKGKLTMVILSSFKPFPGTSRSKKNPGIKFPDLKAIDSYFLDLTSFMTFEGIPLTLIFTK